MDIERLAEVGESVEDVVRDSNQLSASSNRSMLQVLSDDIEHGGLLDQRVTCNGATAKSGSSRIGWKE